MTACDDPGVDQLEPRHPGAGADDGRGRRARRLDVGEADPEDDRVLGDRLQAQRQLGDHRERSLRADEEPGEVVAGRRLAGPRAGADDAAVRRARPRAPAGWRASSRSAPSSCRRRSSPPCLRAWRRRPGRRGRRARARRRRARARAGSRPAETVAVRSPGEISSVPVNRERSRLMPPRTGITWPSRLVPAANGVTGTRCALASASTFETTSVDSA